MPPGVSLAPVAALPAVMVTGGAGYIGSHTAHMLAEQGYPVVVVDNLSTGNRWAVPQSATFVEGDVRDHPLMMRVMRQNHVTALIHFAANTVVPESVRDPLKYYGNNTAGSIALFQAALASGVAAIVFSSTAAVYGLAAGAVASEESPTVPISPYGWSKLMTEQVLRDLAASSGMRYLAFRYFNVAGADPQGRIGQATPNATHLIKVAAETALGLHPYFQLFGTDYDTPDGTAVRDFIHVSDLAWAHVLGLQYLLGGGPSVTLNCGYGLGYSVRQVVATMQEVSGRDIPVVESPPREGDIPSLIAGAGQIREVLGWQPQHDNLRTVCKTAFDWECRWQEMQKQPKNRISTR